MAPLEHGSDFDGEGFAAGVALVEASPVGFAREPADVILDRTAMRTGRAIRPKPRFDELVSGFFVMEMSGRKGGMYGLSP
jgi:hypothetical protein